MSVFYLRSGGQRDRVELADDNADVGRRPVVRAVSGRQDPRRSYESRSAVVVPSTAEANVRQKGLPGPFRDPRSLPTDNSILNIAIKSFTLSIRERQKQRI